MCSHCCLYNIIATLTPLSYVLFIKGLHFLSVTLEGFLEELILFSLLWLFFLFIAEVLFFFVTFFFFLDLRRRAFC